MEHHCLTRQRSIQLPSPLPGCNYPNRVAHRISPPSVRARRRRQLAKRRPECRRLDSLPDSRLGSPPRYAAPRRSGPRHSTAGRRSATGSTRSTSTRTPGTAWPSKSPSSALASLCLTQLGDGTLRSARPERRETRMLKLLRQRPLQSTETPSRMTRQCRICSKIRAGSRSTQSLSDIGNGKRSRRVSGIPMSFATGGLPFGPVILNSWPSFSPYVHSTFTFLFSHQSFTEAHRNHRPPYPSSSASPAPSPSPSPQTRPPSTAPSKQPGPRASPGCWAYTSAAACRART